MAMKEVALTTNEVASQVENPETHLQAMKS